MKYDIKQLSVFLENKAGELSDFTHVLSTNGISIKSILLADSTDFGLVRTIVDNPEKAKAILEDAGFSVRFTDVFGVKIEDVVGSFDKAVSALSNEGIITISNSKPLDEWKVVITIFLKFSSISLFSSLSILLWYFDTS